MIIAFKHGKLANVFDTIDEASKSTGVPMDKVQKLIISGDIYGNGYSFDYPIDGVNYEGWGCEDERNLVV